jgi:adenylosuccinate lyase
LGYDQWAKWLVLVEWFWLDTLADLGEMPAEDAEYLNEVVLRELLKNIHTTEQDVHEQKTKHDIIALQHLMKQYLPQPLHRWLHLCATSYDIIETAYTLQLKACFERVFQPQIATVSSLWRQHIEEQSDTLQAGRTHLQTALPVTVGFWLAGIHRRFVESAREAQHLVRAVPGKFSGAVGTSASQVLLFKSHHSAEKHLMEKLGIPVAVISTQVAPPEARARFYHELVLLSGAMANLGEDVRILQSSQFGELGSASSTSSAMSHKQANPIAAEQLAGMHATVIAEYMKVMMTLVTDLQRDLRASNVMRSYAAVMVYTYQQLLTAERLLKSLTVKTERCRSNFAVQADVVVAEALHLEMQRLGFPEAHQFVNEKLVPWAMQNQTNLQAAVLAEPALEGLVPALQVSPVWEVLLSPEQYFGRAVLIACTEFNNIFDG